MHFLVFQDLQDEVQRESVNLQKLQAQKQQVQELLDELDEQKAQLEEQLKEVRKKCAEEAQLVRPGCLLTGSLLPSLPWCKRKHSLLVSGSLFCGCFVTELEGWSPGVIVPCSRD